MKPEANTPREPEDGPPMQYVPGRYYLGLWFIELKNEGSRFGHGGDRHAQVWRKDDEPRTWFLLSRIRWYKNSKVWESDDKKIWNMAKAVDEDEATVEAKLNKMAQILYLNMGRKEPHFFEIRGDCERFETLEKPYYMHIQQTLSE